MDGPQRNLQHSGGLLLVGFQIRRVADMPIENINRLRHQNAEQPIAHRIRGFGVDFNPRAWPNRQPVVD